MFTFTTIYLMVGCYVAFMIHCGLEEDGINGDQLLPMLPYKIGLWLYQHPNLYQLFILAATITIILIWPYLIYQLWKHQDD